MKSFDPRSPLLLALALATPLLPATRSSAVTITVTDVVDDLRVNGNCTLREAIVAANTDLATDGCAAGSGEDEILLPAGIYRLGLGGSGENDALTGDLDIRDDLHIQGAGREVTIVDGSGLDRVLHVDPGQDGINVFVSRLTVRGGSAPDTENGGGISNFGSLTLIDVLVADNSAANDSFGGGIYNAASLALVRSEVRGNSGGDGGGIFSEDGSSLDIASYSRISGNVAASNGGGISNGGDLDVRQTLLDGNRAGPTLKGGGLINNGNVFLRNVTLSGNRAGVSGGAIHNQLMGVLDIESTTIAGNTAPAGGGIFNENPDASSVQFEANLLTDNAGGNCAGTGTPPESFGYSLEDADDCSLDDPTDLVDVSPAEIGLGPLADNGGYLPTRALAPTSVAVDGQAAGSTLAADQRGARRPVDGDGDGTAVRDIGAFERIDPIVVDSFGDGLDALPGDGVCEVLSGTGICTLRAAIQEANATDGWKLVELEAGTYDLAIAGAGEDLAASGDLDVSAEMTLRGRGAGETIVDGQALDRIFDVLNAAGGYVTIEALTVRNGAVAQGGGCVRSHLKTDLGEGLRIERALLTGCVASFGGGLELVDTALAEVRDSAVRGNVATPGGGGGIRGSFEGRLLLLRSEISGNESLGSGGGMEAGVVDLVSSTVSGNTANNGGGIFTDALHSIWSSTIAENTATSGYGGGLFVNGKTLLHSSIVADNSGAPGEENCGGDPNTRSRGFNLESTDTCMFGKLGDQADTPAQLGPLADNGGLTRTHALSAASAAVDRGGPPPPPESPPGSKPPCLPFDQRGVKRPYDGDASGSPECDVGAFEREPPGLVFADGFESGDTGAWSQ